MTRRLAIPISTVRLWRVLLVATSWVCAGCTGVDHDDRAIEASLGDGSGDPIAFYASQSPTTDPGEHAPRLDDLPWDVAGIVAVVQGLLIPAAEVDEQDRSISRRRFDREVNIPTVRRMLARITELDDGALVERRPRENRMVGICAQYAMLTTALLRHRGIPARARGGFETYMSATAHHDHWIAEYWNAAEQRWVRVDAEIEGPSRTPSGLEFDPLDLPPEMFMTGADAWRMCRSGRKPPVHFGIWGGEWFGGWDFVINELLLDFNALNKVESLPWDEVGFTERGFEKLDPDERKLLDDLAAVIAENDADFGRIRDLFRTRPELRK